MLCLLSVCPSAVHFATVTVTAHCMPRPLTVFVNCIDGTHPFQSTRSVNSSVSDQLRPSWESIQLEFSELNNSQAAITARRLWNAGVGGSWKLSIIVLFFVFFQGTLKVVGVKNCWQAKVLLIFPTAGVFTLMKWTFRPVSFVMYCNQSTWKGLVSF